MILFPMLPSHVQQKVELVVETYLSSRIPNAAISACETSARVCDSSKVSACEVACKGVDGIADVVVSGNIALPSVPVYDKAAEFSSVNVSSAPIAKAAESEIETSSELLLSPAVGVPAGTSCPNVRGTKALKKGRRERRHAAQYAAEQAGCVPLNKRGVSSDG